MIVRDATVIHKGVIPDRVKAMKFGEEVLEVMRAALKDLREKYPRSEINSAFRRIANARKSFPENLSVATISPPSILDTGNEQAALEGYLEEKEFWHAKFLLNKYLESPRCNLEADLSVINAVQASRQAK